MATVLDRWNDGETAFMTTRYLPGGSLKDLIADSRKSGQSLPVAEILRISAEIANGLAHIHGCRILYLDLQPKNVRFDQWRKSTWLISTPRCRSMTAAKRTSPIAR
jgi:serine/threonine protein kinase